MTLGDRPELRRAFGTFYVSEIATNYVGQLGNRVPARELLISNYRLGLPRISQRRR